MSPADRFGAKREFPGYLGERRIRDLSEIHWTPLAMGCGCVIDWGWGGDGTADPLSLVMFLIRALPYNCQWHGAETGPAGAIPRDMIVRYQDGPGGKSYMYARRAALADVPLGQSLTRQVWELLAMDDPEVIALAPFYAEHARDAGEDPAESIRRGRLIDLILNRGKVDVIAGINHWESKRKPGESWGDMLDRLRREMDGAG